MGCAPDLVVCPESNPLWDGPVLLSLLGQLPLDEERLLGRLQGRIRRLSPCPSCRRPDQLGRPLRTNEVPLGTIESRYAQYTAPLWHSDATSRVASSQKSWPVTPACAMSEHRDGQSMTHLIPRHSSSTSYQRPKGTSEACNTRKQGSRLGCRTSFSL